MEVFTKWNSVLLKPEIILLIASSHSSNNILTVFTLAEEVTLNEIGSIQLSFQVKSIMLCMVDNAEKIVLQAMDSQFPINIYNIELTDDGVQIW